MSVCLWTQFCLELFSYSFACTALKFIHMKLCMCNFHDHLSVCLSVYIKLCICNFHVCPSVCPWTQFCLELPLLGHCPFCDQNLLYDNTLMGIMITFSDSSSFKLKFILTTQHWQQHVAPACSALVVLFSPLR